MVAECPECRKTVLLRLSSSSLVAPARHVLWLIRRTSNAGTTTRSGSHPLTMPRLLVPGFVIAVFEMKPMTLVPSVSTPCKLTAGEA